MFKLNKIGKFTLLILTVFLIPKSLLFAQTNENITITTYYPSPYGSYDQLQAYRLGIGDTNNSGGLDAVDIPTNPGDVWIAGNVGIGSGIGTTDKQPSMPLEVDLTPANSLFLSSLGIAKEPNSNINTGGAPTARISYRWRWHADQSAATERAAIKFHRGAGSDEGFMSFWTGPAGVSSIVERIRLASDGSVGIGITAPHTKLEVSDGAIMAGIGASASPPIGDVLIGRYSSVFPAADKGYFKLSTTNLDGANGGLIMYYLYNNTYQPGITIISYAPSSINGYVGIGTTNPVTKLHVRSGAASASPPAPWSGPAVIENSADTYLTFLAPDTNENGIFFGLAGATVNNSIDGGIIYNNQWGNPTGSSLRGFQFRTGGNNTAMVINSNGNVGMGLYNPAQKLTVAGNIALINSGTLKMPYFNALYLQESGGNPTICFIDGSTPNGTTPNGNWIITSTASAPRRIRFGTCDDGGWNFAELFAITNAGNVGIGTANPLGKLDVYGAIYQRGSQLHADYVFNPDYKLESIDKHAEYMFKNKHLTAVPQTRYDEKGLEIVEIGASSKGILEELEKAHIYIHQLNERIKTLESKIKKLEAK